MTKPVLLGCVLAIAFTQNLSAQSLPVTPGMWESTTTLESELMGTRTTTETECITVSEYDPKTMLEGLDQDQCNVAADVSGNTMTIDLTCEQPGVGTMKGEGTITVDGDTMTGKMTMAGDMAGQQLKMNIDSTGKRVGDC